MAELAPSDVQTFTTGRLRADDEEVARMLNAALVVARRETGWHVSPVKTATFSMDGPDSRILWLPTTKLVTLTSISEDGTALDVDDDVTVSVGDQGPDGPPVRVRLRKRNRSAWSAEYDSIAIVMNHGYTEEEAADWRQAILGMVDQMSLLPVSGGSGVSEFGMSGKRVDDVDYRYSPYAALAEEVVFSVSHILCNYALPSIEYF